MRRENVLNRMQNLILIQRYSCPSYCCLGRKQSRVTWTCGLMPCPSCEQTEHLQSPGPYILYQMHKTHIVDEMACERQPSNNRLSCFSLQNSHGIKHQAVLTYLLFDHLNYNILQFDTTTLMKWSGISSAMALVSGKIHHLTYL